MESIDLVLNAQEPKGQQLILNTEFFTYTLHLNKREENPLKQNKMSLTQPCCPQNTALV